MASSNVRHMFFLEDIHTCKARCVFFSYWNHHKVAARLLKHVSACQLELWRKFVAAPDVLAFVVFCLPSFCPSSIYSHGHT